jgi:heavy metal sensor kinase
MIVKSIKWRLLLWMACLLTLIQTGLGIAVYEIHLTNRIGQLDEELRRRVAALGVALYAPGPPGDSFSPPTSGEFPGGPPNQHPPPPDKPGLRDVQLPAATLGLFEANKTNGLYFALWSRDADVPFKQSDNAPAEVTRPKFGEHDTGTYTRSRGAFREAFHATERGDCVLVGRGLAPELADARRFAGLLFLSGLGLLALILTGAWWLIGRALQPVEKISAAAVKISSGDLSQRISAAETESELGKLTEVLNTTFARLETAFAQQMQFTADAAHELRTPLAVLISEAQTTLARERSPTDYRESMAACLDTAQKMRQLTEALLELARLDVGQAVLHREKINLAAIAQDCTRLLQPLAAARNLKVHCDLSPAETCGDATRIAQVVTNLLSNAISYNRDGGKITVATCVENNGVILRVADTGCGISAADLPRVFERFYRADKSRSGGGNGLGLSICQAIVTAHGGTIEVSSQKDIGATFTVRLPVHSRPV